MSIVPWKIAKVPEDEILLEESETSLNYYYGIRR